jgi:hypothetical protein
MEQDQVLSLLKGAQMSPNALEKIEKLLTMSMDALGLIRDMRNAKSQDEQEHVRKTLIERRKLLSNEYETILQDIGMTKETLEEYVANPKNFSQENWEVMQQFKREFEKQISGEESKVNESKKQKKHKMNSSKQWMSA